MKHTMKKIVSLVLVFALSAVVSLPAFAEQKSTANSEILKQAPDYYSAEHQKEIQETSQKVLSYIAQKHPTLNGVAINTVSPMTGASKYLSVSLLKQEKDYYCGPASAQMTIKYVKGTTYSQSSLATDMGTDLDDSTYVYKLSQELNNKIGSGSYQYVLTSDTGFADGLIYSIDKNRPVVCHTATGVLPNYTPSTSCHHYIVSIGYSYDTAGSDSVRYNDPNNNSAHYGVYNTTWSNMTDAINNNAGFYIMST